MALSNWDTLAFDHTGAPCNGTINGFDGASASIYKNWLYVRDSKMWTPGRRFVEPTIAEVDSGQVTISEFEIVAHRHDKQDAMFVLVICPNYKKIEYHWMAGIGCSGFSETTEIIAKAAGVNLSDWEFVSESGGFGHDVTLHCHNKDSEAFTDFTVPWKEEFESKWIGVTVETREAFFDWLKQHVDETPGFGPDVEWLEKCRNNGGLRFNQGDMWFAQHGVNTETEIVTPVGEQGKTVMNDLLDKMKKKLDE